MKPKIFIVMTAAGATACQTNQPTAANQTVKPTATIAASVTPDKSKIKTYDGKGVITKINLELGSVELNHEEIKGAMPAMQMEFYVSDKKLLNNLKVGDAVDFVLENSPSGEQIISIKKK